MRPLPERGYTVPILAKAAASKGGSTPPPLFFDDISLSKEAERRYLNYALSVITARALPDARDGLKPVQRRILYTMQHELRLAPDSKPRKSAAVVGDVMGKYHPHGDASIYDAMVRLAQDWVLRAPLVEGQGNFGSVDGDAPAAMRYTEAKLRPLAGELLAELGQRTVDWRPNYDGTRSEPTVLPARFPNLLVNGAQGIAVGMATSIPPHNLGEVIDASIALIDDPNLSTKKLVGFVKGPDFPTGGLLQASKRELETIYETGSGSLKLRGEWTTEEDSKKGTNIIVTAIPFGVERGAIVEKIAQVILSKKLPTLVDVRDESTAVMRIVLELKKGADPQLVMAYLFKQTPLAQNVQVNMTCLVPEEGQETCAPKRLGLRDMLRAFLDFRELTLRRRLEFELGEVRSRIHILEGFEIVFDALDEIIKIIRASDGRKDAQEKLMKRFSLSAEQTDAILELRLYRLAKLEILMVRKELAEKRAEAKRLEGLLKSTPKRWSVIKDELESIRKTYGDKRRTKVSGTSAEPEFQEEDFIVQEDANVILSAQGWVKRLREVKDLSTTRLRDGDTVLAVAAGSTRSAVAFFSNHGSCYVCRVTDVPASTGYGDPVQKLFKLGDGERMIAMLGFDPRVLDVPEAGDAASAEPEPPFAVAVTRQGLGLRFSLRPHRDPSTRSGRKFARLNEGDEVVMVSLVGSAKDVVVCIATDGHAIGVKADDLALLSGAGKGTMVIKLDEGERLAGASLVAGGKGKVDFVTEKGKEMTIEASNVVGTRGGKGDVLMKRDRPVRLLLAPPEIPTLKIEEEG
ncbi:MAG: DNA topoisomerase IV subunit A [Polyangiaceae bacterium]|nr:DNA topoisomerase IV subunit A [Polyangiaceae bacterium]